MVITVDNVPIIIASNNIIKIEILKCIRVFIF